MSPNEKYETILRRSALNTRMRDFYDVYVLMNFQSQNIDSSLLRKAIKATAIARGSIDTLKDIDIILELLSNDEAMQNMWTLYQRDFTYADDITWLDIIKAVRLVNDRIIG